MPTRGRDLEPRDQRVVAAHLRQLGIGRIAAGRLVRERGRLDVAAQSRDEVLQGVDADDLDPGHERGLASARARDDEPFELRAADALRHGEDAAHGADLARQRELADHRRALDRRLVELMGGDEQRDRERQVERRPDLAQVGRREVDRDAAQRELVAGVHQRGAHPLAGLAHGLVREADDGEGGQPLPDVGLHPDPPSLDAVDREGHDPGEHQAHAPGAAPSGARAGPAAGSTAA